MSGANPHPERLYYEDPYLTSFRATVVACEVAPDGRSARVTLDRTAFYPESGGQPSDHGSIDTWRACQVIEDEASGRVVHVVEGAGAAGATGAAGRAAFPQVGATVDGRVDADRRRDHRQQHAGQHVLSAAFEKLYDAATIGFHLGEEVVTIDLDRPSLAPGEVAAAEDLANSVVLEDRPIIAHWMTWEEASRLPLRKPPARREGIRVIEVSDFDWSPCGGTHPRRTGEIGPIKIIGLDRVRGGVRVIFVCGHRALRDYRLKDQVVRDLASAFSVPPAGVPEAGRRLAEQAESMRKELNQAHADLIAHEAEALWREGQEVLGTRFVCHRFGHRPMPDLKLLSQVLAARGKTVAVLATANGDQAQVVLARSADLNRVDLQPVIKEILPHIEGRGGGSPGAVQGGGPRAAGLDGAVARGLELIRRQIEGAG